MLVGERLAAGFTLYSEIWDSVSPLSAMVYAGIEWISNRSVWVYRLIAMVLTMVQAILVNRIVMGNNLFPEKNYLPAMVYVLITALSPKYLVLSPALMATTFLLVAMYNVVSQIEFRAEKDEKLFATGIYLGIAGLFHFPMVAIGVVVVIILLLFSSTVTRRYLLLIFGYALPFSLTTLYYFFVDNLQFFWQNHVTPWFWLSYDGFLTRSTLLWILVPLLVMVVLSMFRIILRARLSNYQGRVVQAMLTAGTLTGTVLLFEKDGFDLAIVVLLPFFAFFISFFFTLSKKSLWSEFTLLAFAGAFVFAASTNRGAEHVSGRFVNGEIQKRSDGIDTCAVVSDEVEIYAESVPATPFLNWRISESAWQQQNRYQFLFVAMGSLLNEEPNRVYDPSGYFHELRSRQPLLRKAYEEGEPGLYVRRPVSN